MLSVVVDVFDRAECWCIAKLRVATVCVARKASSPVQLVADPSSESAFIEPKTAASRPRLYPLRLSVSSVLQPHISLLTGPCRQCWCWSSVRAMLVLEVRAGNASVGRRQFLQGMCAFSPPPTPCPLRSRRTVGRLRGGAKRDSARTQYHSRQRQRDSETDSSSNTHRRGGSPSPRVPQSTCMKRAKSSTEAR